MIKQLPDEVLISIQDYLCPQDKIHFFMAVGKRISNYYNILPQQYKRRLNREQECLNQYLRDMMAKIEHYYYDFPEFHKKYYTYVWDVIQKGANKNLLYLERTPLIYSILGENLELFENLINYNVDVNLGNPLRYIICYVYPKNFRMFECLIDKGANIYIREDNSSLLIDALKMYILMEQQRPIYKKIINKLVEGGLHLNEDPYLYSLYLKML